MLLSPEVMQWDIHNSICVVFLLKMFNLTNHKNIIRFRDISQNNYPEFFKNGHFMKGKAKVEKCFGLKCLKNRTTK